MQVAGGAGSEAGQRARREAGRERREIERRHARKIAAARSALRDPPARPSYPSVSIREVVVHSLGDLIAQTTPSEPDPATGRRRSTRRVPGRGRRRLAAAHQPRPARRRRPSRTRRRTWRSTSSGTSSATPGPTSPSPPVNDWEVLVAGAAPRPADPAARLDLLAARGRALRDGGPGGVDRSGGLAARLEGRAPAVQAAGAGPADPGSRRDGSAGAGRSRRPRCSPCRRTRRRSPACWSRRRSTPGSWRSRAAFTLCSDKRRRSTASSRQQGLGEALTKIVIPAAEAGRIRDQLDLVSVDERRLFPDLDGVAAHLRRYYS